MGCARNDVDSEELAGRLAADGWELAADGTDADVVVVNTCGFVDAAKKDSIDALLAAAQSRDDGSTRAVVAVGCLAERYGEQLAEALPEADAVLGFDDYPRIAARLDAALGGVRHIPHTPRDRRRLLPLAPAERPAAARTPADLPPGLAPPTGPRVLRRRLGSGPVAPVKLAAGCDRRCAFCAIPSFRGAFVSRPPGDILTEARWLAEQAVRELVLVSENSTSYGKDLGDLRALEALLPDLAAVDGIARVRVNYLQPAEMRPGLIDVLTATPGIAPYFDLSFQHSSASLLRRMRRFGDTERFLGLLEAIRSRDPHAGIRTNVIVGFPGETDADLSELERFLTAARLDAVGVFGYSDEEGTEAAGMDGKVDPDEIRERVERVTALVEQLMAQRAEDRVGQQVQVLVEPPEPGEDGTGVVRGRAAHQGPDVDGDVVLTGPGDPAVGDLVTATVVHAEGADLVATAHA